MKSKKASLSLSFMILSSLFGVVLSSNPVLALDVTVCKPAGCDYTVIQTAINAVSVAGGGTVTVTDNNIYDELITMKDGVDVVSDPYKAHIRRFSGMGREEVVSFSGAITCDLRGFEITNPAGGAGIFMDGSAPGITATIENCDIHDCDRGAGIRLNGVVKPTITGSNIYSNDRAGIATAKIMAADLVTSGSSITIKGTTIGGSGQGNGNAGIRLDGSGSGIQVAIGGSVVDDANTISYNTDAGIRLEDIDQVSIENNDISNNSEAGILLIDVSTVSPHIKNNDIHDHTDEAGINIGGASNVTITGDNYNSLIHDNYAGIVFYVSRNTRLTGSASSQPVLITGSKIYSNTKAGIAVIDNVTGTITIDDNKIYQNTKSGVGIFNKCTAIITDNDIYTHTGAAGIFTGDWSGTPPPTGTGFLRDNGPANLSIKRNKVYGNRAGMRVDHASGTINNNLVYGNSRAGIRFSGDNTDPYAPFTSSWGITEIMNNTMAGNGSYVDEFSEDRGNGIAYDAIYVTADPITGLSRNFNDPPVGATQDPITIKNNIVANNKKAGIKFCADNSANDRSYNLFYMNFQETCATGGAVDCGRMCRSRTLGKCYAPDVNCCEEDSWVGAWAWAIGEICGQDPLFDTDYTLLTGSPAINAGSDGNDMGAYGGTDPITF